LKHRHQWRARLCGPSQTIRHRTWSIYTGELGKVLKKMAKLERRYEVTTGAASRARIMKTFTSASKRIPILLGLKLNTNLGGKADADSSMGERKVEKI